MSEEVDHLRQRQAALDLELKRMSARLDNPSSHPDPQRHFDITQRGVVRRDLETVRQQIARAEDDERRSGEQVSAVREATFDKLTQDETAFWFRRFFTTLGIAHAAAFVALTSGFLQSDDKSTIGHAVADALTLFASGMIAAGLIPLLLWAHGLAGRSRSRVQTFLVTLIAVAALVASGAFVFGIMEAVGAIRGLGIR